MSKKVLVVDDALFMRQMLRNILILEGYTIHEAEDGQKAIEAFKAYNPDLVLMDITMPVMDGITATKEIIKEHPSAKVIVCSAMGQQDMVMDAIRAGAKDFIVKPFEADRVKNGVGALIGSSKAAA